jgi:hypothetical protein
VRRALLIDGVDPVTAGADVVALQSEARNEWGKVLLAKALLHVMGQDRILPSPSQR